MFEAFLREIGSDRMAVAPDLAGYGESAATDRPPTIAEHAWMLGELVNHLGLARIDLLGYGLGAAVAVELAYSRPEHVRRVVLVSVPVVGHTHRAAFERLTSPPVVRADGSHVAERWAHLAARRGTGQTIEMLDAAFTDSLRPGDRAGWAWRALGDYPIEANLARLAQPTLLIVPADSWMPPAMHSLVRNASLMELPDLGQGLFDVAPARIAQAVRAFLRQR